MPGQALDGIRASATQLEVSQATSTADLAHLEATAVETVQATLADVLTEVEQLERDGAAVPDTRALSVDEGIDDGGDEGVPDQPTRPTAPRPKCRMRSRPKTPSRGCAPRSTGSAPST